MWLLKQNEKGREKINGKAGKSVERLIPVDTELLRLGRVGKVKALAEAIAVLPPTAQCNP